MKRNGNDQRMAPYYLGLDVGTNSVGWAVTDIDYKVLRFKGNSMWGVRLFEEANNASDRRLQRTARRRLARRKQRLSLLEMLFHEEITKVDPTFFIRLHNSSLHLEDKADSLDDNALFSQEGFTDREFHSRYKTFYHLRKELVESKEPHDPRLVFLALHHILKARGHFLFEMDSKDEYKKADELLVDLENYLWQQHETEFVISDPVEFLRILADKKQTVTAKKRAVKSLIQTEEKEDAEVDVLTAAFALTGAKIKLSDLFYDEEIKNTEVNSLSLAGSLDEIYDSLYDAVGERVELLTLLKSIYDSVILMQILGDHDFLCQAKVAQYEINKNDLKELKAFVREIAPEKYGKIFRQKKDKLNNFAAYSKRTLESGDYSCSQADFCKFLRTELSQGKENEQYASLWEKIETDALLPRLRGSENSVIPNQVHRRELNAILKNAQNYLPFLIEKGEDGLTVADKILSLFDFRIPYYVGPLNPKAAHQWAVRSEGKIYPWNFEQKVDLEKSAESFLKNLINRCTYTGDDVLPKDSLLYSEFMLLNEINPLKINGNPATLEQKQRIVQSLFVERKGRVTKKSIQKFLAAEGLIGVNDEVSGIDDTVKSSLRSYHDFKALLERGIDTETVEQIILRIIVFGNDKKMLRSWLRKNCSFLTDEEIKSICRLKYQDWGRLSRTFLTEIYSPDENGEAISIIQMMRQTNCNLNKLLSKDFLFAKNAEEYRREKYGTDLSLSEQLAELYVSPPVRRSILQTLKIVDEIVDIKKAVPEKIFIEVARENDENQKGNRTVSRKNKLIDLYRKCGEDSGPLFEALNSSEENALRRDKLYLYYTQFGKCMYSGEPIDLESLDSGYDIDHIFPQSRIKDDSLNNRVLVKRKLDGDKGNSYPIQSSIREKMQPFWLMLKSKGLIDPKKYERLIRNTPLTEEELASFVSRQLVETRQSTVALATILKERYGISGTKLVYSKAGNVSDFRKNRDMNKCREINDLHHAKDAYLNIVVGNVYHTRFTEQFFRNIQKENYSLNRVFDFAVEGAWNPQQSMQTVRGTMAKNNILVTRRSYTVKGKISDLQIVPAGKGQLAVKQGLSVKKYGGYNKVTGAYFTVVEHKDKKKRIRTVEPVYLYQQKLYEADPVRYCEQVLELVEPRIIVPMIRTDSLLEIGGKKMYVTGRSGQQLLFKHSYQLSIDYADEMYIKDIRKYVDRCKAAKAELPVSWHDKISTEQNEKLFDLFMDKMRQKVYAQFFDGVRKQCEEKKEKFLSFGLLGQCELLLEILKSFKCDRQLVDLKQIDGSGTMGDIRSSKKLTGSSSAYLIHQSVTGLYEYKEDLLR